MVECAQKELKAEEEALTRKGSVLKKLVESEIVARGATIDIKTIEMLFDILYKRVSHSEWRFSLLDLMNIISENFNMLCTTKKQDDAVYIYKKCEEASVSKNTRDNYLSKIRSVNMCMRSGDSSSLTAHEAKRHEYEQMRINTTLSKEMTEKAFRDFDA